MYSSEKNVQILISLMKEHGVKKIIISPGSANLSFVASVQEDSFFELYSCIDERSAAYMACGMAEESGEAVAISCTGATASRNYLPALTEAFYRKLPILAITSTRRTSLIGHNIDQVIDRSQIQHDVAKKSITLPIISTNEDEWECNVKINDALLELNHHGKGPVHINLITEYSNDFSIKHLHEERVIKRYYDCKNVHLDPSKRCAIFVGSHSRWSKALLDEVDLFCEKYNSFVMCDQTSNYKGKYGIYIGLYNLIGYDHMPFEIDIILHIGNISAIWPIASNEVWRINPDGNIRDTYRKLSNVFEMEELSFFHEMNSKTNKYNLSNFTKANADYENRYFSLIEKLDKLPFSSLWIAGVSHKCMHENTIFHFGILNSLRCWNCFRLVEDIHCYSNVGGFGIDGGVSSLVGASLCDKNTEYYGIFGDLAFFYDLNSIGNRHIMSNIRIMVINNGLGVEFKRYDINVQRAGLGDKANKYIAAEGHFGEKSRELIKHYSQDLGFMYITASTKEEYEKNKGIFFSKGTEKPILFEVFVDEKEDSESLLFAREWNNHISIKKESFVATAKQLAKSFLGEKQ